MYEASFMPPMLPKLGNLATPIWGATANLTACKMPNMGNRLKEYREARHWTQERAAEEFGLSKSGYIKLEIGARKLNEQHLARAAKVYGVNPSDVLTPQTVEIVGLAGAGPDGSVLFAHGDENFGETLAPSGSSEHTRALEVRGESMYGLANDGWLLFYDDRTEPRDEYMGEPCVCWLPDGRVLVKVPQRGRGVGLFNLESVNAQTLRDVAVTSMALVTDIKPRRAAERYVKRHPFQNIEDIPLEK